MTAPGWYPDPQDAGSLRYFDGERWTGERHATHVLPADESEAAAYAPVPQYHPSAYPSPAPYPEPRATTEYRPSPLADDDWRPPSGHRATPSSGRRRPVVVAICAALLAGALTGAWFALHRSASTTFTFDGHKIDDPSATLSLAERSVDALVASRHGVKSAETRCYFAVPDVPAKGAKKTDVDSAVRCGPVLFVDGDAARTYLTYPLSSTPAKAGDVTLTPAAQPINTRPGLPPIGFTLRRPDGKSMPADVVLAVPPPPATAPNTLVAAELGDQTLPDAPAGALMVSLRGGVRLAKAGPIERFGTDDAARVAPPGQQLIAFTYAPVPGQVANINPSGSQLGVSVNGGAVRRLPAVKGTQAVVLAVPAKARAEFVLDADGVRQTLALPTGAPGPANLAVLRRSSIDAPLSVHKPITFRFTRPSGVMNLTGTVTVTQALLGYWTDDGKHHASGAGRALLWMDFRFQAPHQTGETGIDAPLLRLTPAGGPPIAATDVDPTTRVLAVFDVPATFAKGTVTISGTEAGNPKISVLTPVTFGVSFPG